MEEKPLDLEQHEEETLWDVWKRRLMFLLLIALCITFAAPSFNACEGTFGGGAEVFATFKVGGEQRVFTQDEFQNTWNRLAMTSRLLGGQEPDGENDVWAHILQNAAAEAEGIHVPDAQVSRLIASVPIFQETGQFDDGKYRGQLSSLTRGTLSPRNFQKTLAEMLRVSEYRSIYQSAFSLTPSREAFEQWQARNTKLTATYVVQPFAALEADVESASPDDGTLSAFAHTPDAAAQLRVPARKVVEAAFLRVGAIDDVQFIELENRLRDLGLLTENPDVLGAEEYHGSQDAIFTQENWLRTNAVYHEAAMQKHAAEVKAWEDAGKEGEKPTEPPNPALTKVPEDFLERYELLWRDRVLREVYSRLFLEAFAKRAERENRSFADLAGEYEVLGLRVVQNEEPIADLAFRDEFPEDLGRDSEMDTAVQQYLRGPAPGSAFIPEVHTVPVPTTMLGDDLDARGYMVLRLVAFEPSRTRTLDEAREEIVAMWRKNEVRVRARNRLEAIQKRVEAGEVDLATAAADAGLEVHQMRRFNFATPERRPPVAPPGGELDAEAAAAAARIKYRNRIVRDYPTLSNAAPGAFRRGVMLDDSTEAAYLVRVDETHAPTPAEMRPEDLRAQRLALMRTNYLQRVGLGDKTSLLQRFELEVDKKAPTDGEDADDPEDTGDGDGGDERPS